MNRFTPSWQSGDQPDDTTKLLDRYHDLQARCQQLEQLLKEFNAYIQATFPVSYQEGEQMQALRKRKQELLDE